jgi:hypothetical protein
MREMRDTCRRIAATMPVGPRQTRAVDDIAA